MTEQKLPAFEAALKHTLAFEGGYVNDPKDSGGETFRGVSRRSFPGWFGWKLIDQAKADGLKSADAINQRFAGNAQMAELVSDLYFLSFWRAFNRLEGFERLRVKLFDTAVNTGIGRSVKLLQESINLITPPAELKVDGGFGPKTRAALEGLDERNILFRYVSLQEAFYRGIVERKPSQQKYLNGWLKRAAWMPE